MIDARHSRVVISGSCDQDNDAAKQKPASTVNMHGGIYINNIEHIEHFHAPTDNSTDQSTSNTQVNAVVAAENADIIKELLLVFKGDAANAQSFLSSIRGALPTQVTALVNDLTMQNLIVKELRFKHLWHILNHHGLYAPTLQNWNKQIR